MSLLFEFLFRWAHVLFGILWIGLLYYFNFVQTEYFKEAAADAKADAVKKLAPRALWWFRWGAMFTFLSGWTIVLYRFGHLGIPLSDGYMTKILTGGIMGTLMWFNVWFIIWPNQKKVLGMVEASDEAKASAATSAMIFSRANTLLSLPMFYCMINANHG